MGEMRKYVELKEYIVTLVADTDLNNFYTEIETKGRPTKSSVPERAIECIERRPTSINTHYMLTDWEAEELRSDPRVRKVSLHPRYLGIRAGSSTTFTQTSSNWNKSSSTSNNMLNFALLRCTEEVNRSGWGSNGTPNATGTVTLTSSGKHVDVVGIDDNGISWGHPEFAVNADGTGGTRSVQYNWFQHNDVVKGTAPGTYSYGNEAHSTHCAGTTCGSTLGWARSANIYNIYYLAGDNSDYDFPWVMDYVRAFHANKTVNPATGRKNPTITNNSWGMSIFPSEWSFSDITAVTYRGTRYTPSSGATNYTGYSGVCTANDRLATLAGFENFGNRITTAGPYIPPGGAILTKPESWVQEGQQAALTIFDQPDATYTLTIDGPADINLISDIAMDAISGVMAIDIGIEVRDSTDNIVYTYSDSAETTNGGTISATIVQDGVSLPGNETYTVIFNSAITVGEQAVVYAVGMSLTVVTDAQAATATVNEITNSLLGAAALTVSTFPNVGNNDDGFWQLNLPFSISYLGNSYSTVYVGTNTYLTFTAGSSNYSSLGPTNPNLPKIMWGCADNSAQRIYYGTENVLGSTSYTVVNSGASAYTIDSANNPTLDLKRGWTYTFAVNSPGHPFWIKTAAVTGTGSAYSTGVTNNGIEDGSITFTVPLNAPDTLYYICQFHSAMQGTINITNADRTYRIRVEGNGATGGVVGSPGMVHEYVFYEATPAQIDLQLGVTNRKTTGSGFSTEQLNAWGFIAGQRIPARVAALDADIETAIDEGIIYVGAAGNGLWKHDLPGGLDWDNTFEMANRYPESVLNPYYYMRGSSPTANDTSDNGGFDLPNICVGATDVTTTDQKSSYSDCGPGVDIWAPGTQIISSLTSGVSDARNGSFFLGKFSGTSMASPQVCGVLACALEQNPHWNQEQAKAYITGIAKVGQLVTTAGGPADIRDIQGAPNKFLYYRKDRPETGLSIPRDTQGVRPNFGQVWPRPKIYRFG